MRPVTKTKQSRSKECTMFQLVGTCSAVVDPLLHLCGERIEAHRWDGPAVARIPSPYHERIFFLHMFHRGGECLMTTVLRRIFEVRTKLPRREPLKDHLLICRRHVPILRSSGRHVFACEVFVLMTGGALLTVNSATLFTARDAHRVRSHLVALRRKIGRAHV